MGKGSSPNCRPSASLAAKPDAPCRVASRRASLCRVAPSRLSLQVNAGEQVLISVRSPGNPPASSLRQARVCSWYSGSWKTQRGTWPEALDEQGPDGVTAHTLGMNFGHQETRPHVGHGEVGIYLFIYLSIFTQDATQIPLITFASRPYHTVRDGQTSTPGRSEAPRVNVPLFLKFCGVYLQS